MTPTGAAYEIRADGVVQMHRAFRETAIVAAYFLQQRQPAAKIVITDLRDGSAVEFEREQS